MQAIGKRVSFFLLATVAACAPAAPPPVSIATNDPARPGVPFHCPKPGTRATFGASTRPMTYTGTDPADPLICTAVNRNGTTLRRVANFFAPPPGQERAIRDGMAPLFPIVPGTKVQFDYFQDYRNDRTKTGQFMEEWTVEGPETLMIGGKPVQTYVFNRSVENNQTYGSLGYTMRLWFAPDSGVWVKSDPTLLRGSVSGLRPTIATSLTVP